VEVLLANNAQINMAANDGDAPLHYAAGNGHRDVVEFLLANQADVNALDKQGFTPLHYAVARGHKDVAALLHKHGGRE
jgi:ankyrin repeat protein